MIRRLVLRNWRSYKHAVIEFGPGTTFVIASNGVGKTSLVEAARWALFGTLAKDGRAVVRLGADSASAIVELELPNLGRLTIERSVSARSRSAAGSPVVHLDGRQVSAEVFDEQLSMAYKADPAFLGRLTMPAVDGSADVPTALHLEEHLGRYFGVDSLRTAVEKLHASHKANASRIKRTKEANVADERQLEELRAAVKQTALDAEQAGGRHRAVQGRLGKLEERERFAAETRNWQAKHAQWMEAVERLASQYLSVLDNPVTGDTMDDVLAEQHTELSRRLEEVRVAIAVNKTKEEALRANEERLDAAHDDCPVCRRPLDEATVDSAHASNSREVATISDALRQLDAAESDLRAQVGRIRSAQAEWRRVPRPGERPAATPAAEEEPLTLADLKQMENAALDTLVEARAGHSRAVGTLEEALKANESMRRLEVLFGQEAKLTVAIEAAEATLTELLERTVQPLASEVNQRWGGLFSSRGSLTTRPDGSISRDVEGHPLAYSSFSTGERMGATIVLRLLIAQMVTSVDFCWFDEPLEHFDPGVRRHMARALSRATIGNRSLRQVVVTTYEEPLARRLQAPDDQRVHIIDVRQPS
jgi:DNA repair exonuclease SbcCD ATPase subunit